MLNQIWKNFTDYIIENYNKNNHIIEIGVGKVLTPSQIIEKELSINIKLIDIHPTNEKIIKDDITKPNLKLYKDADLIYSIRPPEELQQDLVQLAKKINADLIIKPLSTEEINHNLQNKFKLINYHKTSFYIMKKEELV